MKEERSEGIVLRATPFSDTKRILTVFLPEEGMLSLATRSLSPTLSNLSAATSPLTCSELIYRRGRGEVHRLIDANPLEGHLELRTNAERLDCACEIAQILLKTQLPGKAAPLLYELTKVYLDKLQRCTKPINLLASFYLKLLKHEGLLHWTSHCAFCLERPVSFFCKGEGLCAQHRSHPAHAITHSEWEFFGLLADSRSFQSMEIAELKPPFLERLRTLATEML